MTHSTIEKAVMANKIDGDRDAHVIDLLEALVNGAKAELFGPCILKHRCYDDKKPYIEFEESQDYRNAYSFFYEKNSAGEHVFRAMLGNDGPVEWIRRYRKEYMRKISLCYSEFGIDETIKRFKLKLIKNKESKFQYGKSYAVVFWGIRHYFEKTHGEKWRGWGRKCNSTSPSHHGYIVSS